MYQDLQSMPQIAFHYDLENSFEHWASGTEDKTVCTVNTAQAALSLVASGLGYCFMPESCLQPREGVVYVPLQNWHQALYMCILYDKWLEPPVWDFIELVVKGMRRRHGLEKE